MKKNLLIKWVCGIAIIALTMFSMVLLLAEPSESENFNQFASTLVAMKVLAIVCGALAIWLAGKLTHKGCVDNATNGTEVNNL